MTLPRYGHLAVFLLILFRAPGVRAEGVPPWLPRYDLEVRMDLEKHLVHTHQQVIWTNRHHRPTSTLVFNAHAHYKVPRAEIGFFSKTLELLRMTPQEALDTQGEALQIDAVYFIEGGKRIDLPFHYEGDTGTNLVVMLPRPVHTGEHVALFIDHTVRLPQKMGRWGQWEGVTYLSNWLPVLAVYGDKGWEPVPFIPWHQPFFNEAGMYAVRVTLPADQNIACSGTVRSQRPLPGGLKEVTISAAGVRDFAFLCSARYREYCGVTQATRDQPPVKVRILAFEEHEYYAREMIRIVCEAIPVYAKWFGAYPWEEFSIAEAFFGWNGNECSTLVMIDSRVFAMPHLANSYVDYLVSHELCHQWWYNLVGTNGYCETWMDESMATHFAHRLMTQKYGKHNELLKFPRGLEWLPNIRRSDYRNYGLLGTIGRGENTACVQEIPKFKHLINLFSMCYDKGSRVIGMIEDRLGEAAFLDFSRLVQCRYRYRILRVADFQRELEDYTGQSWKEFFDRWVFGEGLCDWAIEKVHLSEGQGGCHATIILKQKAEYNEQTVLGIALSKDDEFPIRIPVFPEVQRMELAEHGAVVEALPCNRVKVEVILPCKPAQIAVDPDHVVIDRNPGNNFWKVKKRVRFTPLYTALDETDLTNAFDSCNYNIGPYVNRPAYNDPWYARSTLIGVKGGLYRTQCCNLGAYAAYRTDYRDVVVGAEGTWEHRPQSREQIGFNIEQRVASFQEGRDTAFRAAAHVRHILQYGSSLYLPPFEYVEGFAAYQDNFLPFNRNPAPGARRYDSLTTGGVHYQKNILTPYWDPIGGLRLDLTYAGGSVEFEDNRSKTAHQFIGSLSLVKGFPDLTPLTGDSFSGLFSYLADTRIAVRLYAAGGLPDEVEYFPLGSGTLFRGYDQRERQGSLVWLANLEWRLPVAERVQWDFCDHVIGIRNIYSALFYDVGDAYTNGKSVGTTAHAVGAGLRMDMAVFGFVERCMLRLDFAKTINDNTPLQFWLGVQHPF